MLVQPTRKSMLLALLQMLSGCCWWMTRIDWCVMKDSKLGCYFLLAGSSGLADDERVWAFLSTTWPFPAFFTQSQQYFYTLDRVILPGNEDRGLGAVSATTPLKSITLTLRLSQLLQSSILWLDFLTILLLSYRLRRKSIMSLSLASLVFCIADCTAGELRALEVRALASKTDKLLRCRGLESAGLLLRIEKLLRQIKLGQGADYDHEGKSQREQGLFYIRDYQLLVILYVQSYFHRFCVRVVTFNLIVELIRFIIISQIFPSSQPPSSKTSALEPHRSMIIATFQQGMTWRPVFDGKFSDRMSNGKGQAYQQIRITPARLLIWTQKPKACSDTLPRNNIYCGQISRLTKV